MNHILKTAAFLLFALSASIFSFAGKVRLIDGDLSALKGVSKLNLQMDYSDMGVGKFATEQEYLDKKQSDYNAKEPGRGDAFVKAWKADRKNMFEPQFIELFTKHSDISLGNFPKEKYTLIFKTQYTEPGYNIYISKKNAEINGEAWIVETANPGHVIAKMSVPKCPGRAFGGNDYESGVRIRESYAVAGKILAKFLADELK